MSHAFARLVFAITAIFFAAFFLWPVLQILKGVTQRGTGASAARLKLNIAGKTGTTNDFTDAWFIGMTPRYTIGVWVGNDMKTQTIGKGADGARTALPIWIRILEKMKDLFPQHFAVVALGFATGWRPSSLRPLRRTGPTPDVLWDENVILARRSHTRRAVSGRPLRPSERRTTCSRRSSRPNSRASASRCCS